MSPRSILPAKVKPVESYTDMAHVLEKVIETERSLDGCYRHASERAGDTPFRDLLEYLRERHRGIVASLEELEPERGARAEWFQSLPEIPGKCRNADRDFSDAFTPRQMIGYILDFEEQMRGFYRTIADHCHHRGARELFETIHQAKDRQCFEIRSALSV